MVKKDLRAQAAFDFLTTYAWALIAITIIVGAFLYFAVLNPKETLPSRCIFSSEIGCRDAKIGENGVELVLKNNLGKSVFVDDLTVSTEKAELTCNTPEIVGNLWDADEVNKVAIICDLADAGIVEGKSIKLNLKVTYYDPKSGSAYLKDVQGELLSVVDSEEITSTTTTTITKEPCEFPNECSNDCTSPRYCDYNYGCMPGYCCCVNEILPGS